MARVRSHLSFANVTAVIAMFVALSGVSYAAVDALPKNSVGSKQLRKNAVNSEKVIDGSLLPSDFKAGSLPAGPKGEKGDAGPKGDTGPQGEPGPKGDTGPPAGSTVVPAVSATNSVAQTATNNSFSSIGFNGESFDTANMHPNGAENRKLIAPKDGIYELNATATYEGKAGGFREIFFAVNENSTNPIGDATVPATSAEGISLSTSALANLKAGDYVVLVGYQNSGSNINIYGTGNLSAPFFSMHWVGPAS